MPPVEHLPPWKNHSRHRLALFLSLLDGTGLDSNLSLSLSFLPEADLGAFIHISIVLSKYLAFDEDIHSVLCCTTLRLDYVIERKPETHRKLLAPTLVSTCGKGGKKSLCV